MTYNIFTSNTIMQVENILDERKQLFELKRPQTFCPMYSTFYIY